MIKAQLQKDMKEAMKAKDKSRLSTIRLIIDKVQKKEKEVLRDITEEEVFAVLQTFKKQTEEELTGFVKVGKLDRVDNLKSDLQLVENYLPKMMNTEEIKAVVIQVVDSLIAEGISISKGAVMKALMPLVKGKADNKQVNDVVTSSVMF